MPGVVFSLSPAIVPTQTTITWIDWIAARVSSEGRVRFNDEERRCAGAALIRRSSGAARTNPNPNKPPTVRCYADDEGRYAHDCYFKGKTIWIQATDGDCTDDDGEADGMACFMHDM